MKKFNSIKKSILICSIVLFSLSLFYPSISKAYEPSIDGVYWYYDEYFCQGPWIAYLTLTGYTSFGWVVMGGQQCFAKFVSWYSIGGGWCGNFAPDYSNTDIFPWF